MATVTVKDVAGKDAGSVELDDAVFGIQPNVPLMHQVVVAQLARRRAGTQSTKTRAEVSGGGRKPFKQKGTGNARQGSTRAPHFAGGGVALGPKPRSYAQKTPKKMVRQALRCALSDRAAEGKIVVVETWGWTEPKTKQAVAALAALGVEGKALVVVDRDDIAAIRSFTNLPEVQLIEQGELNAYDVLCNDVVVFTSATLPSAPGEARTADSKAAPTRVTPGEGSASDEPHAARGGSAADPEPAIKTGSASDEPTETVADQLARGEGSASDEPAIQDGSAADDEPAIQDGSAADDEPATSEEGAQ